MTALILAACVAAPLALFVGLWLAYAWTRSKRAMITAQAAVIVVGLPTWIGVHYWAWRSFPELGQAIGVSNMVGLVLVVLSFIGLIFMNE